MEKLTSPWISLSDPAQLEEVIRQSHETPVVLFKHSVTCGISAGANHHLISNWDDIEVDVPFYYLDLLAYRSISNDIASRFNVIHQSPQVIVIRNGEAVYHTSHHAIQSGTLNQAINKAL